MTACYSIYGVIPLRDDPGAEVAAKKFIKTTLQYVEHQSYVEEGQLFIDIGDTFPAGQITILDEAIAKFAAVWSAEVVELLTEYSGERGYELVGPEGFDKDQAEIDRLDRQIAELQERRNELLARTNR